MYTPFISHYFKKLLLKWRYFCTIKCLNWIDLILGRGKCAVVKHLMLKYIALRHVLLKLFAFYILVLCVSICLATIKATIVTGGVGMKTTKGYTMSNPQVELLPFLPQFPAVLCHQITSQCNQRWIKYFFLYLKCFFCQLQSKDMISGLSVCKALSHWWLKP